VTLGWAANLAGAKVADAGHNVFTGFPGFDGRPAASLSLVSGGPPISTPGMRETILLAAGHSRLSTIFPDTGLGHELGQVAELIATPEAWTFAGGILRFTRCSDSLPGSQTCSVS
jgi:hypothetical protein